MVLDKHHYIYDHSYPTNHTVEMSHKDHMHLHSVLKRIGYVIPHINESIKWKSPNNSTNVIKSISITDEQADWVKNNEKNLSWVIQRLLQAEMEKDD